MTESTVEDPDDELLAVMASFRRSDYRVLDMEHEGFTHVETECAGCGQVVAMPFRLLRERRKINDATTLEEIGNSFRCTACSGRSIMGGLPQPWYQYMGTPADEDDSPVGRALNKHRSVTQ